jgi:hypothetical protein
VQQKRRGNNEGKLQKKEKKQDFAQFFMEK